MYTQKSYLRLYNSLDDTGNIEKISLEKKLSDHESTNQKKNGKNVDFDKNLLL